jgi:hypothetical protein
LNVVHESGSWFSHRARHSRSIGSASIHFFAPAGTVPASRVRWSRAANQGRSEPSPPPATYGASVGPGRTGARASSTCATWVRKAYRGQGALRPTSR